MKFHRIYGVILRFLFLFRHSLDRLSDAFYWPTIDLLLWGLTSTFVKTYINNSGFIIMVVTGILLWLIVWRAQYEITVNILEDLWNDNFINLFVSPLSFNEWTSAFVVIGVVKGLVSVTFASGVAYLLYRVNFLSYGLYLIPFLFLLFMTGWAVGYFVAGLIVRYGTKVQMLAWSVVAVLSPFSGIYYPISILPHWAQQVSKIIPTSYIFEGARSVASTGSVDPKNIFTSFALSCLYLILALWFLRRSFLSILRKGLVSLK